MKFQKVMQWRTDSLKVLTDQRPQLEQVVQNKIEFHRGQYVELMKINKPHEVAYFYCMGVEKALGDHIGKHKDISSQITCGKGCGACCKMHTIVSLEEAKLLLEVSYDKKMPPNKEYLESQVASEGVKDWNTQTNRSCVFLGKDNSCTAYEYRPIACRKCFSLEDPIKCDMEQNPSEKIKRFISIEVEAMASGIMNATEVDSMPRMLLKAMEERNG